ncbi:hypothetical protein P261_02075 [Lachnospiraceae bacterium TWA4]|nr:hypothetical protein P261_02075 [Lachnospiraceae bacterium TWA4]
MFIHTDYGKVYYKILNGIVAFIAIVVGVLIVFLGTKREILRLQKDLEEERALKDQLIKSMAHDLRTPLTGLMAFAEVVKKKVRHRVLKSVMWIKLLKRQWIFES